MTAQLDDEARKALRESQTEPPYGSWDALEKAFAAGMTHQRARDVKRLRDLAENDDACQRSFTAGVSRRNADLIEQSEE